MSLLMDALRKAEADKNQADASDPADRARQPESHDPLRKAATDAFELALEPQDDPDSNKTVEAPAARAGVVPASHGDTQPGTTRRSRLDSADLALEPIDAPAGRGGIEAARGSPARSAGDPSEETDPSARLDQTSTLPSMRAVQSQLEEYFDHSQSLEISRTTTAPAMRTGENPLDSTVGHTVVTAQTVFDAGPGGQSRVMTASIAMVAVVAVALLGAGVFYFQKTPMTRDLPSPLSAGMVERAAPKPLPILELGAPQEPERLAVPRIEPPAVPVADGSAPLDEPPAAPVLAVEPPAAPADVAAYPVDPLAPPAPAAEAPLVESEVLDLASTPPVPVPVVRPATPAPEVGVRPGELRIARRARSTAPDAMLGSAYAAVLAGDLATAERQYREILAERPLERDALLGMAAVAMHHGRIEQAYGYYDVVRQRYPKDATANAALFMLEGGAGDRVTESRLKLLLDQGVETAYINFALGNLYVRQNRWADAQQVFFKAYRDDSNNADYSFNLAVSLDRMGQHEAALDYYQKALALADQSGGSFNTARVLERIQGLTATRDD